MASEAYYLRRSREITVLYGPEAAIDDLREFAEGAESDQERSAIERAIQAIQKPISATVRARIIRAEQDM